MADIKLPALPMHHSEDWFTDASEPPTSMLMHKLYTGRQLRARDLEVARVVLEAAAKVCDGYIGCDVQADRIRALEFKHHE